MPENLHVLDLIPAYALGCLDKDDEVVLAEHLQSCEACRQELLVYQNLADQIPLALTHISPPPEVKQSLMEAVARRKTATPEGGPVPFWQRITAFLHLNSPAWALGSLAVVLLLATSNLLLWRQANQAHQIQMPLVGLHGTNIAPDASGTIVISRDGLYGSLVVDQMKPLGDRQQYQVWLIKDGAHTSGGVFSVDESGYASLIIESPQPLSTFDGFRITIETAGGSQSPTGPTVLSGNQ